MEFKKKMTGNNPYIYSYGDIDSSLEEKAKNLLWEYNNSKPNEDEKKSSILQQLFGTCSAMTFIEPSFRCDYGFNIHTSGLVFVNYNCVFLDTSPIYIGDNVLIGPGTCLTCAGHAIDPQQRTRGISKSKPIIIENDVWIGANCTIVGGVTIGAGSVVGAGSIVTKDIPSGVVAVGNPCRVIREITEADKWIIEK